MTRLSAVLAAYVVISSTHEIMGMHGPQVWTERRVGTMQCTGTQEECEDLAEALNEARERRILGNVRFMDISSGTLIAPYTMNLQEILNNTK